MSQNTVLAVGYLITVLLEAGMTLPMVLQQVKATGVVPPEEWDLLDAALLDAQAFWGAHASENSP